LSVQSEMNNLTRRETLLGDEIQTGRTDVFDTGINVVELGIAMGGKFGGGEAFSARLLRVAQLVKFAFQIADSKHCVTSPESFRRLGISPNACSHATAIFCWWCGWLLF
jgi:hypothetical protein